MIQAFPKISCIILAQDQSGEIDALLTGRLAVAAKNRDFTLFHENGKAIVRHPITEGTFAARRCCCILPFCATELLRHDLSQGKSNQKLRKTSHGKRGPLE